MASENRPGVEVEQKIASTSTVVAAPDLVPLVVGVCHQIIEALDSDGALNSDAKYSAEQYNQASLAIPQADLPDPRDNIDELEVDEGEVNGYLYFGGTLTKLDRGSNGTTGSAFLKLANLSTRAAIRSTLDISAGLTFSSTGDAFNFYLDVVNTSSSTAVPVEVELSGSMTADAIVDAINTAAGADVAELIDDTYLQISSQTYGAVSSVTLQANNAGTLILFQTATFTNTVEYRVEGSGFVGQDDEDGDTYTPWIEFFRGGYFEDGADTTFPVTGTTTPSTTDEVWGGLIDQDDTFSPAKAAALVYTGTSADVPLQAATTSVPGDQLWASGVQVGDGEIIKVEQSRFKIGKLSTTNSTFDDDGVPTVRVYDTIEVATLLHGTPWAPKYAYFVADGLVFGEITPEGEAASVTGSETGLDERSAYVVSGSDISFPLSAGGLTLEFAVTEDGEAGDTVTYTFTSTFTDIGELVSELGDADEFDQFTVSAHGDFRLVLQTTKTGADQAISIKSTGSANGVLGFSTTAATEDDGTDVEFATQATVTGARISLPLESEGSSALDMVVTDSKGTHTLSATGVDLTAGTLGALIASISGALGGDGTSTVTDNGIPVGTLSTSGDGDASGTITFTTTEGGANVSVEIQAIDGDDGFRHCGFFDDGGGEWAQVDGSAQVFPLDLTGGGGGTALDFEYHYDIGGAGSTSLGGTVNFTAVDVDDLAEKLNAEAAITDYSGERVVWFVANADDSISIRTVEGGTNIRIEINTGTPVGLTNGATDDGTAADNADADGADGIKGTTLGFTLDDNPYVYEIIFSSNSLADAIDDINELVDGSGDVASETSSALTLTSLLEGAASAITIEEVDGSDTLGLEDASDTGAGRPNPDFYQDDSGVAYFGPNILRSTSTGIPYSLESALADIYIAYEALRLDVTPSASSPAALEFDNTSDIEAAIGPISIKNPLALGMFLAKANTPSNSVTGFGVDEATAAAPMGTLDGWARALEFAESREVFCLASLTDDSYIQSLIGTHIGSMSKATNRGERIAFIWSGIPTRDVDTVVASGTDGETNGTDDSFNLDVNPASDLIANGLDPTDLSYDDQVFLQIVVTDAGASELRRYSVSIANGVVLTLRTSFDDDENEDGFFTTATLDESLENVDWTLYIRGEELLIAGSSVKDLNAIAQAVGDAAEPYGSRRIYYIACDDVETSIDGTTFKIPGYYLSAAYAGMAAEQLPQQPFTHMPLAGIGRVYGTDDTFSEDQMDTMADGGRWVMVNLGGVAVSRHQRSTDNTSVETMEFSITRALDWLSKGLRKTNRVFIGRSVITPGFLDQLTMSNEGFLDYAEQLGAVQKADLTELLQSEERPDTVLAEVETQPSYPCNKISITVVS